MLYPNLWPSTSFLQTSACLMDVFLKIQWCNDWDACKPEGHLKLAHVSETTLKINWRMWFQESCAMLAGIQKQIRLVCCTFPISYVHCCGSPECQGTTLTTQEVYNLNWSQTQVVPGSPKSVAIVPWEKSQVSNKPPGFTEVYGVGK